MLLHPGIMANDAILIERTLDGDLSAFEELLEGTAAAIAYGVAQGAQPVRTHDVRFMARVVRMVDAIMHPSGLLDAAARIRPEVAAHSRGDLATP